MPNRPFFAAALPLVLLAGCATNAIRIDRAHTLSEAGRAASEGTRAYLDIVAAANREKLIAVAALDPNCTLPDVILRKPNSRSPGLCVDPSASPPEAGVALTRFNTRAFAPTIVVLNGLTAYLDALDEILTRKRPDVGDELARALADAQGAASDVSALAGVPEAELLSAAQRDALTGLVSLIAALANEAATVDDLRRLETPERSQAFDATMAALRRVQEQLPIILENEIESQEKMVAFTRARDDPRANRAAEIALIERRESIPALTESFRMTLDELAAARAAYIDLLSNANAKLTPEERAKRVRLQRERLLAALSSLANVRRAFFPGAV